LDGNNAESPQRFTTSINPPLQLRAKAIWLVFVAAKLIFLLAPSPTPYVLSRYDVLDYVEDPHAAARWMFDQQQQMVWPFKTPGSGAGTTPAT
jgi:hypothetical protein